jgi:acetyltransferase-like isoleucine patch superfamily enzyme
MFRFFSLALSSMWFSFLLFLPDEYSKYRVRYYNRRGCKINRKTSISPNVRIKGRFEMGFGSSIAQNCTISGENVGIFIGENVMIAPNVVLVAFNHGFIDTETPMVKQVNSEGPIIIEDDVWIASNCTIGKGVRIGKGSIIAANSFVNKNVPPYSIYGGVPAKLVKSRIVNAVLNQVINND